MTDPDLSDLLERAADRFTVGPAPVGSLLARAASRRRRRTLAVMASSAAAVVVAMVGTALLLPPAATPKPAESPSASPLPPGSRLVGIGHAAIAVPASWGTNQTRCGTPQQDTVVIDVGATEACLVSRPAGTDSVELTLGQPRFDFHADSTSEIDGVAVQRQRTSCAAGHGGRTCVGTVFVPSLGVSFRAESSTDSGTVDEILGWIRFDPDNVGVPGYQRTNLESPQTDARERYVTAARSEGLTVEVTTKKVPGGPPGYILAVSPDPGTMVPPGAVVSLTVVADPEGPADEVSVGVNSVSAGDEDDYHFLSDAQVRAGATVNLQVGASIWAVADGKRSRTLAGTLDGTSLSVDPQRSGKPYPPHWIAARPGTTKLTITITADGQPVTIGVVTVVVA